jgi:hypothetical protein
MVLHRLENGRPKRVGGSIPPASAIKFTWAGDGTADDSRLKRGAARREGATPSRPTEIEKAYIAGLFDVRIKASQIDAVFSW